MSNSGFSVNKQYLITNLQDESLIAHYHVWWAIRNGSGVSKIVIFKKLY